MPPGAAFCVSMAPMSEQVAAQLTEIAQALEGIEQQLAPKPVARVSPRALTSPWWPDWPWAPATNNQGFITSRWQRRDGDVYQH